MRRVKAVLVFAAVAIAAASLFASHFLVRDLSSEEHNKMEVWAEAMRTLNNADANTDMNLVLKVINGNNTIPVVVMDKDGAVQAFRNLDIKNCKTYDDSLRYATSEGRRMLSANRVIKVYFDDKTKSDYMVVCYDDSIILKRLASYPYIQLGVVLVFAIISVIAILSSKRAEQNRVWVGLSKETAHQLGTPISSLMAWTEILKESYPNDDLIPEMDKDVKRLQLIADRFSKIGSLPELSAQSLNETIDHVVDYMDRRTSSKVKMVRLLPNHEVRAMISASLFEWVLENLCKNAVDAMEGQGQITFLLSEEGKKAILEVTDTGKGIRKKDIGNVFRPGFTTKKRGWGLGLSLAKRIIEDYHHGRIFIRRSEVGKGTTFRIEVGLVVHG